MFVLKIIVISSAILNIGFSETQCNFNDENIIQFNCKHPECKVENGVIVGQYITYPNAIVSVLGYSDDFLLVQNKKELLIQERNRIKIKDWNSLIKWEYKVSIHKETFKICKPKNVNQSNAESYNDFNNAQNNKNSDEKKVQTSDEVSSKDPSINHFDDNNETIRFNYTQDEDIDESIIIESEDELNPDISSKEDPSTVDSSITGGQLTDNVSANSDQDSNFEPVEQQNDLNETDDQNNITKPTSPKKSENDSAAECSSDSCGKNINPVKNKLKENVVTDVGSNNISPVNEESLNIKKTDSTLDFLPHQHSENTNDDIKDKDNDNAAEGLKTSNIINDSNNKMEPQVSGSYSDNNAKALNSNNDYQTKIDSTQNIPHQHFENTNVDIKSQTNTLSLHNSTTSITQGNDNSTEELRTSNTIKDSNNKMEPQVSDSYSDNNAKELSSNNDYQTKIDSTQNIPHQHFENTNVDIKSQTNTLSLHNSTTSITQGNDNSTEELRISNTIKDSNIKMEPQVSDSYSDNNAKELNSNNDYQTTTDSTQNIPHQHFENTNVNIKDTANTYVLQDSTKIPGIQDSNNSKEIINERLQNSDSLENITQIDNQSAIVNSEGSLTKEKVEIIYKSDQVNVNNFSKDIIGGNLKDNNNASAINETHKQPDIYKTKIESEYQNVYENSNFEHITTTNDQINGEMVSEIVPPIDNQKSIDQCASEGGCLHSIDSTQNNDIVKSKLHYETVYKVIEPNNNEKLKEYEPKSFVASFGHPDTCSGVNCITFNRNVEKVIRSSPVNLNKKQTDPDETSHSTNTDIDVENKNINEITEQSHEEMSFFDYFQNWISSPTTNSINLLWNIFGDYSIEYNDVYHNQVVENQKMFQNVNHSELYFIVVAVITLLFSLVYYKHQKGTYENNLLTLLATKDQSLLILEKELSLLKEQSTGSMISTTERTSEVETLNEHLNKSEDIISSQSIRIEKLEQEVEELTESGMEMHMLLSSALESSSKNTEKLNSLKSKLVDSENLLATLTQKNFDKTTELEKKNDIIKSIQITVDELTLKNMNLIEDNARISLQLEQNITKSMLKESKLLSEINNLRYELDRQTNSVVTAENEVLLSKDALQEMVSQKFNPADAKKFLSSVKLSAELKSAKQMCEGYKHKLNESLKLNQQYLDNIDVLKSDIVNLEGKLEKLEKEKEESVNKLNILTNFFKDQEKDYLKQINEKSALCVNKEGESSSLNEQIKSQYQEIANYKSEIQSLKKEITDQEASFKIQISATDKKASDYWISFRQAERKLKEMELETAQLRNKLSMVDKKLENGTKSIDSSKDFEDELLDIPLPTVSPDFTLLTLLDFEPPPPILTNQRLPPLGALGQASSPPIPLSRRHNRSLSPGSPPPSQRSSLFRPLPQRYNYMDRQNSLGHSVESLDK